MSRILLDCKCLRNVIKLDSNVIPFDQLENGLDCLVCTWYKCLYECLISLGFILVAGHPCLFIRVTSVDGKQIIIVMAVFVDDLLVTGKDLVHIDKVKQSVE